MSRTLVLPFVLAVVLAGCQGHVPSSHPEPIAAAGLHNVLRVSDRIYSGSVPDGDDGFRSLQRLGVRTIISVDGAKPDVEAARRFGLRYVHLPVGYDGVPRDRALQLARAVRDLPGPVYVHCHHGQHRGPAAAVAAQLCLDDRYTVTQAEEILKKAGTDPAYAGLIGLPRSLVRPAAGEIDRAAADFPEVSAIPDLARLMVEVDVRFDSLKLVQKAGWHKPTDHPDLDPPHEARLLTDQFREAARLPLTDQPADLRRRLIEAADHAAALERLLRAERLDNPAVEAAARGVRVDCAVCHTVYRNRPY
jgi:protein tyrosine phosphatase (PTP) superfamily phosphohydrolase (DUF442 family)